MRCILSSRAATSKATWTLLAWVAWAAWVEQVGWAPYNTVPTGTNLFMFVLANGQNSMMELAK
jgi:hypothetical protein